MTLLMGGAELGGTKCVLAVAESPTAIVKRIEISTETPEKTLKNIFGFFSNYKLHSIGTVSYTHLTLPTILLV